MSDFAFDEALAEKTGRLLGHLEDLGFSGEVQLTSHLGQFCLAQNEVQRLILADDQRSALDCDQLGHSLEFSTQVSERLSVPFSRLLREYSEGPLRLSLVALDASESQPLHDYPSATSPAVEWNHVALQNNRVEIILQPEAFKPEAGVAAVNASPSSGQLSVSRAGLR